MLPPCPGIGADCQPGRYASGDIDEFLQLEVGQTHLHAHGDRPIMKFAKLHQIGWRLSILFCTGSHTSSLTPAHLSYGGKWLQPIIGPER